MAEILQRNVLALSISSSLGGSERSLFEFARRAADGGIRLRVGLPQDGPLVGALRKEGVETRFIDELVPLLHLSQQPGKIDLRGWMNSIDGFRRAGRAIEDLAGDAVVYSNSFKTHMALAMSGHRPAVWHVREFPPKTTSFIWALLCAHRADKVIANSELVAQEWRNIVLPLRGTPPVITAIPNGVDLQQFTPRPRTFWLRDRLGIPRDAFVFGMPAAFASWKGQLEVIDAFENIAAYLPASYLVLVGGAIYDTSAEKLFARELEERLATDPTGNVRTLGFEEDVARVYGEFDCTIHYSLRPEPFGRVLIESMACGTPLIAVAEGGPLEILGACAAGRATGGWLTEPRHPDKLGRAMLAVARMGMGELSEIGKRGRKRAEALFGAEHYAEKIAGVLRSAG